MWNLIFMAIIAMTDANCILPESLTFEKFVGLRAFGSPAFVYIGSADEQSLPGTCLTRCKQMTNCIGVSVSYKDGECTGFATTNSTVRMDYSVDYFAKTCMEIQDSCKKRWWTVESTPGYQLYSDKNRVKIIANSTSAECAQWMVKLSELDQVTYRSAQWTAKGERAAMTVESMSMQATLSGSCILNVEDKYTEPESYRVANYLTLYLENQCIHDFPSKIERCSYEEYFNQTLKHSELVVHGLPKGQCKFACENETRFVCRGFTALKTKNNGVHCYLHSSDILTHGSWILTPLTGATYFRRVTCLNITVVCGRKDMLITYYPKNPFRGRMYVTGRGEKCGAGSSKTGAVVLSLPLNGECDVNYAYAVNTGPDRNKNRTMAYAMLVIQNNPIIQTQGDRWIRAGCALPPDEITLNATLEVNVENRKSPAVTNGTETAASSAESDPVKHNIQKAASAILNTTTPTPPLLMYIASEGNNDGVSLGEALELRIETPVPPEVSELQAYHLVATSLLGDSSVLLVDGRGCPTGQVDFPAFMKSYVNGTQRLSARFKAFRFPNSHVVRFAIMVKFCHKQCRKVECDNINRTARKINDSNADYSESDLQKDAAWISRPGMGRERAVQLCGAAAEKEGRVLELSLVVGSGDLLTADRLLRGDHEDETGASNTRAHAVVCVHELLLIVGAVVWLFVQILLLAGCLVIVKRYKDFAKSMNQKDYQHFDNVGFESLGSTHRRVHWPDQNVDILHA